MSEFTVGLTGGIGSGKTTVAKMFEKLGVPVYYADNEAKSLMNSIETISNSLDPQEEKGAIKVFHNK